MPAVPTDPAPDFQALLNAARAGEIDSGKCWSGNQTGSFRGIGPAADVLDAIEAAPATVALHAVGETPSTERRSACTPRLLGMEREPVHPSSVRL